VHIEKTHFLDSGIEEAMPELKKQACLSGADAIIQIQERRGAYVEARSYYVTAQGIRFRRGVDSGSSVKTSPSTGEVGREACG
jgi:hypothetical protein